MSQENQISVEEFVTAAIKEGISLAPIVYMEQLENALKTDVILTEANGAQNYLQSLINEAVDAAAASE
jgi:hypothetical protein